jgi:PAS domain S-box-containing protein
MSTELRKSGIDIIGDIPWGTHFCQFYRTPQDLLDILVPYFAAGLAANEFCMWVTSAPLDKAAAEKALAEAVPGFERYVRDGQIEIVPHDAWYLAGGEFDTRRVLDAWAAKLQQARAHGYDGLRLSGNTFWLEKEDWRAFTDYEAAVDEVIGKSRILALCTYSLERCGANEVLDVVRNHRFALVRRESQWEVVESAERAKSRQSEKRLAQFPHENPHPVLRVDENGTVLYANPSARRFLTAAGAAAGGPLPHVLERLAAQAFGTEGKFEVEIGDGAGRIYTFTAVKPPEEAYVNLYACEVTTRALAETALRDSEAKYRSLFESMTEGFALYELIEDEEGRPADWRVLEVNDAYTRHTGIAREAIVGGLVSELFPATFAEYLPTFARVVATQTPADFETYAKALDRYMHIVTFPVGGSRFASIVEDITARRKAEQALKAGEERYRALFNNMTEGFALHEVVTDDAGRVVDYVFLDVNPAFERLTGMRRDEVMGRNVREVLKDIEPYWIETYGRVALTGEPLTFERYYPEPLSRWFEIYAYSPAHRQFAVVFMDISARKRTEEALRESETRHERSQEIAHLGSWELDVVADRLTWSDEVFRIFGLKPQEFAATYEAFLVAIHPDDRKAVDAAYQASLREGCGGYEIEHRVVRRDTGEVRSVHEKCEHVRDSSGRILRSIGMVHDITEQKQAESLRRALAEQERLRSGRRSSWPPRPSSWPTRRPDPLRQRRFREDQPPPQRRRGRPELFRSRRRRYGSRGVPRRHPARRKLERPYHSRAAG